MLGTSKKLTLQQVVQKYNSNVLAYIGDGVYDLYIRQTLVENGYSPHGDLLHKKTIKYVSAHAQEKVAKIFAKELEEIEIDILKRGKNHRVGTKAKNASFSTYKWATGFEALIGALYLAGEEDRLTCLMKRAMKVIENKDL